MPTVQEALDRFLQIDRSPHTNASYRHVLSKLAAAIGPVRDVSRVTYEDLADYFFPLINGNPPLKRSTAGQYLMVIKTFFEFCHRRGYIHASPAEDLHIRRDEAEPQPERAIPPSELRKMLMVVSGSRRFIDVRNKAILVFMAVTGARTGAVVSLTLDRLDIESGSALIRMKGGKWKRVYFGEQTRSALADWLSIRPSTTHRAVFTTSPGNGARPLTRYGIRAVLESLSERSGTDRVYRPHSVRHARGHSLARRGVEESVTQRQLGHARPSTTVQYYYPNSDLYVASRVREYEMAAFEEVEQPNEAIPLTTRKIVS